MPDLTINADLRAQDGAATRLIEVGSAAGDFGVDRTGAAKETTLAALLAVAQTLTGRLLAKSPETGWRVWTDTAAITNLGAGVIMAEAVAGSAETEVAWRGVFIPAAPGQWVERGTLFRWSERLAGW